MVSATLPHARVAPPYSAGCVTAASSSSKNRGGAEGTADDSAAAKPVRGRRSAIWELWGGALLAAIQIEAQSSLLGLAGAWPGCQLGSQATLLASELVFAYCCVHQQQTAEGI